MPSSRCAHTLSQNKKVERISNLVAFIKTATPSQLSTKLVDVWAHPQSSITDARFLIVFGADPRRLYDDDYGEKTLSERVESGSVCEMCAPKFQSFLDNALTIYECQFGQNPIDIPTKKPCSDSKGLIALSLDGGGMRGLVSVVCLLFTSRRLFGDESLPSHVDWLVGTSTGSMLALALAKGFSLTETFFLYWEMKTQIFLDTGTLSRLFSNAVDKQTVMLEEVLGRCFPDEDQFTTCLRRITVPALDVSTTPARLQVFRNYALRPEDPMEEVSFRDAARASSAAPTYFHPHTLDGRKLVDGSLVANCPLSVLFSEHDRRMKHGLKDNIACIISIGTGEPKHTERKYKTGSNFRQRSKHLLHLGELMFEQVVGHEQSVLESCRDRCHAQQIPFVRISPSGINVRIDQIDDGKLMDMLWTTLLYLTEQVGEVDRLGSILVAHTAATAPVVETPLIENSRKRSNTVL
ncbi:hypothetical protein QR680_002937 [Steinernema hermaphroditum]|uniref:PNPLA domain-containing protein n=1 Tax=Steinernema hermaphroditum TaxID=289476 RepID=A0AA39H4Q1_9BILA|nr:hypothetical protein QR680_002937 [Steinernema hermaphroditum]